MHACGAHMRADVHACVEAGAERACRPCADTAAPCRPALLCQVQAARRPRDQGDECEHRIRRGAGRPATKGGGVSREFAVICTKLPRLAHDRPAEGGVWTRGAGWTCGGRRGAPRQGDVRMGCAADQRVRHRNERVCRVHVPATCTCTHTRCKCRFSRPACVRTHRTAASSPKNSMLCFEFCVGCS